MSCGEAEAEMSLEASSLLGEIIDNTQREWDATKSMGVLLAKR